MAPVRNHYQLSQCTKLSALAIAQLAIFFGSVTKLGQPHIILIVADDLGWHDVSWHNPNVKTPNLEFLARNGVKLNYSYVQPVCTPSRSAILSGYYPFRVGLQHGGIKPMQPKYLSDDIPIIPERLRELGYATHMVGKWHLGFCNWKYTPTHRGFDSFFGFYNGGEDYYRHNRSAGTGPSYDGYDFRYNEYPYLKANNTYSTDLFVRRVKRILTYHDPDKQPLFLYIPFQSVHAPLQVPHNYLRKYGHIRDERRRMFLGMVSAMDKAVGRITQLLLNYGYLSNSIIVFTTDNGGPTQFGARNWPLRGGKGTIWEGGTRAIGFVYSPTLLEKFSYVYNGLIHAVDWFPTLIEAAGGRSDTDIDGVSQWNAIRTGGESPRKEFVYNTDDISEVAAIRSGDLKLVQAAAENIKKIENKQLRGMLKTWKKKYKVRRKHVYFDINRINPARRYIEAYRKRYKKKYTIYQVFNITADPREKYDLAPLYPEYVRKLKRRLRKLTRDAIPAQTPRSDIRAHPMYHNGFWSPGWC